METLFKLSPLALLAVILFSIYLSFVWMLLPILLLRKLSKLIDAQRETNRLLNFLSDQTAKNIRAALRP